MMGLGLGKGVGKGVVMWAGMGHWCLLAQGRIQLQSQQRQLVFSFLVSSVGTDTIQLCSSLRNK